ncbi:MAG: hypothetical protein KI790_02390 [Cyclobacteriaceae bacterium]|nr:hypothetical protein [Cyclobacteriaceae bacterium HetDA_MAG_MS6]
MSTDLVNIAPSFYGITMIPKEHWKSYGHALLAIAGSDGDVSDPELEWLTIDLAEACGVDERIVADWEEFDFDGADLEEIFSEIDSNSVVSFNKLLIYDAIRMSYADDDYADEEREQVAEAADILKLGKDSVMAIESLVEMERAVQKLRVIVL